MAPSQYEKNSQPPADFAYTLFYDENLSSDDIDWLDAQVTSAEEKLELDEIEWLESQLGSELGWVYPGEGM